VVPERAVLSRLYPGHLPTATPATISTHPQPGTETWRAPSSSRISRAVLSTTFEARHGTRALNGLIYRAEDRKKTALSARIPGNRA
jgi:hypothetical protein